MRSVRLCLVALVGFAVSVPKAAGFVPSEVYVWQRTPSPELDEALRWADTTFAGTNHLWLEASWRPDGRADVATAAPLPSAANLSHDVGLSLRIGAVKGSWRRHRIGLAELMRTACARLAAVRGQRPVRELQVDFDAYPAQLRAYRSFVAGLRQCAAPTPVTVTALPSWLEVPAFAELAADSPGYVLQLHGLEATPQAAGRSLYRSQAARAAVAKASALGVPFRIAVPAYLYGVTSDAATGRVRAVDAEQPKRFAADGDVADVVAPDVAALAADLAAWRRAPPAHLVGVLWFRLPLSGDEHAFSRALLADLAFGRAVSVASVSYAIRRTEPHLADVVASGGTGFKQRVARRLSVAWNRGVMQAGEAFFPCRMTVRAPTSVELACDGGGHAAWVQPGDERLLMWLRVADAGEVVVHVVE